jgi:hypothetical protein
MYYETYWRGDRRNYLFKLVTNFNASYLCRVWLGHQIEVDFDSILLHDIFHHAALGVPRTQLGEFYTIHLDLTYPCWDQTRREHTEERKFVRAELIKKGVPVPTRHQLKKFRAEARAKLGYIDPRTYRGIVERAFHEFASGPVIEGDDIRVDLIVNTHERKAHIERVPTTRKSLPVSA